METDRRSLEDVLEKLNMEIRWIEFTCLRVGDDEINLKEWRIQREYVKSLLLTEEKRRLLETIIGWMTMAVYIPHQKGTIFIDGILDSFSALVEIHKRVGFAKTIEELDRVSKELTEFSEKHPELRNN